jgi:diguanylate cyclase (GGDEF)-like protein
VSDSSLTQVLGQSEHIHELVRQSAKELSSVNAGAEHALANRHSLPGVEVAFAKNDAVTRKLREASERLTRVHQALKIEIRDRTMVDYQLAAAVEQEESSRNSALHDNLTGLPNRVLFKDRLEHAIAQAKRHRWVLAVMFLDLDKFKSINDTYGHQAGDAVLRTTATRLKDNTRDDNTVSRYGGDEFLCLLTQLHEQADVAVIAVKILKAIQAPCNIGVRDILVNPCIEASIGISIYPINGVTASALVKSADEAMYEAKQNKSGYAFAQ